MYEIASAEEQITLFKLITDKVWQSLADQKKHQDEQAAQQRRQAAMTGIGRAKRGSSKAKPINPLKPIKPVPVAPPPRPQPIQPTQQQTQAPTYPNNTNPTNAMTPKSDGLADERIAYYLQERQQSAILPIRLR
jgi:hypothetical protein